MRTRPWIPVYYGSAVSSVITSAEPENVLEPSPCSSWRQLRGDDDADTGDAAKRNVVAVLKVLREKRKEAELDRVR